MSELQDADLEGAAGGFGKTPKACGGFEKTLLIYPLTLIFIFPDLTNVNYQPERACCLRDNLLGIHALASNQ